MQSHGLLTAPPPGPVRRRRWAGTVWRQQRGTLHVISVLITLLLLLPLLYLVVRATGVGSAKAIDLLLRPRTLEIIRNSALLAFTVTFASLVISLPLAWLTTRTDLPWRRFWSVVTTLPLVFPSYIGAFALMAMLGPRGMVQGWLEPLGIERLPSIYGFFGAACVLTAFTYPYLLLSLRAGFRRIDPTQEEAARSLGYTAWQGFWRVTVPHLRPSMVAGSLLVALYVISDFGAVASMRYNTFTRAIYVQYLSSFDRSLASLLALVLVVMTVCLLIATQAIQGRQTLQRSGSGIRQPRTIVLGRWRWVAVSFCILISFLTLVMPTAVILYWFVRGLAIGESFQPVWQATFNSVHASALAAAVSICFALPVAYLSVRFPTRLALWLSRIVYMGYGLPGIVIALSLVFFGANYLTPLYQTLAMLIFAYTVRFLPQAMGALRANLLQISPRLEEAGRGLGLTPRQTLWQVTAPLLRPGLWTSVALVFLSTIKELPATLLLGPTGFSTLATQIWSATAEAFFARAAAPALLLLLVSTLSIVIILQQEERGAA